MALIPSEFVAHEHYAKGTDADVIEAQPVTDSRPDDLATTKKYDAREGTGDRGDKPPKPKDDPLVKDEALAQKDPAAKRSDVEPDDTAKLAKEYAGYSGEGQPGLRCGDCDSYIKGGRCMVVEGKIGADDWCVLFTPPREKYDAANWEGPDDDAEKKTAEAAAKYSLNAFPADVNRARSKYGPPMMRECYAGPWDEGKHPRGQPGNPGQFGPGGGSPPAEAPPAERMPTWSGPGAPPAGAPPAESPPAGAPPAGAPPAESPPAGAPPATGYEDLAKSQQKPDTPPPPGDYYNPDPAKTGESGMPEAARVGVESMAVPPPPKINRLPNLTPEERQVETRFASWYERDPDGAARQLRQQMAAGEVTDGPSIFNTDDTKKLSGDWAKSLESKATMNTSVHQTANALTKRAFLQHLDDVVMKLPEGQRKVLVTAGGVGSGKTYAIGNVQAVNDISQDAAATWDAAGDQNSTECQWVMAHCQKRGIKTDYVYIHANAEESWAHPTDPKRGVMNRSVKKGRMVDARIFADSYDHGPKTFKKFADSFGGQEGVNISYIDNASGAPQRLEDMPESALSVNSEQLYDRALSTLSSANVPEHVKTGGSSGIRIWGPPKHAAAAV